MHRRHQILSDLLPGEFGLVNIGPVILIIPVLGAEPLPSQISEDLRRSVE